jgi:HSP20 family protein
MLDELNRIQNQMNFIFGRLANDQSYGLARQFPALNLWEDDNNYFAEAELPGVKTDKIEVFVNEGNQLTLQGERLAAEVKAGTLHRQERGFGKFSRTVALPGDVDADRVDAKFERGILRLTLPKAAKARARKITVKGS